MLPACRIMFHAILNAGVKHKLSKNIFVKYYFIFITTHFDKNHICFYTNCQYCCLKCRTLFQQVNPVLVILLCRKTFNTCLYNIELIFKETIVFKLRNSAHLNQS